MPNDVLLKHGWVLLATPVLLYAIDKVSEIADKVMDNNYNLVIKANGVEVNLQKQPCVIESFVVFHDLITPFDFLANLKR